MKKLALLPLLLAACVSSSMSYMQTEQAVAHSIVGNTCYRNGWVENPPQIAAYVNAAQSTLRASGDPAHIAQAQQKLSSASVTREDCRQVEMFAWQHAQQQAESARQREAFQQSMNSVSQSANQIRANTPVSVNCQYYQWGNMTSCSWF